MGNKDQNKHVTISKWRKSKRNISIEKWRARFALLEQQAPGKSNISDSVMNLTNPALSTIDTQGNETDTTCSSTENPLEISTVSSIQDDLDISLESISDNLDIEVETPTIDIESVLEGRRIVNIEHIFKQIQNIVHVGFDCTFQNLSFINERRRGLSSSFHFKCKMCGKEEVLHSEKKEAKNVLNSLSASGAIATGIGYSQMNELFMSLNIPFMANSTYLKYFEDTSAIVNNIAWDEMKKAGVEEHRLAIEAGEVRSDGIPIISVVADGAWSKRSYRTNYNALSGVACVIGRRTNKILYLGVRNKYCTTCESEKHKDSSTAHLCFKNWKGSSTSMESDIVVQAFKNSISMHNLIYGKLIADGDSSVYRKLVEAAPYGPRFHIEKIECKNHILRNYISKLSELRTNTAYPLKDRKILFNKIHQMRRITTDSIDHWANNQEIFSERVCQLGKTLKAIPQHVFGDHKECSEIKAFFCNPETADVRNENCIEFLNSNLFKEIKNKNERVCKNAYSLLHNVTNNFAECYNSIVAKFVGGKRVNYSLKGSYGARCQGAAVTYNCGSENYHLEVQKRIIHGGAGTVTTTYCDKKRKIKISERNRPKTRKIRSATGPDLDYGATLFERPDMQLEQFQEDSQNFLLSLGQGIEGIERATRDQATSEQWKQERKNRLTASNFGRVCHMRKTTNTRKFVSNLLYDTFRGNVHTRYGQKHEQVAVKAFEDMYKLSLRISGLIISQTKPFLAASPDRVIEEQMALVEIKCPSLAQDCTPVEGVQKGLIKCCIIDDQGNLQLKPDDKYMYQVQGQMLVSNYTKLYFVIWTKKGMSVQIIHKDHTFCKKMELKLEQFYMGALLPELIDSRRIRDLPIRDFYMT